MRFRNSRLRLKITALLLSLAALWAFAAWVTAREGINLLWVSRLNDSVAQPLDDLQPQLQLERRLSVIAVAAPTPAAQQALDTQRAATDKAITKFEHDAQGGGVDFAASSQLKASIAHGIGLYQQLQKDRAGIDSGVETAGDIINRYSTAVESVFEIDDALSTLDDQGFAQGVRNLVQLNRSREVLSQEDATASAFLSAKHLTPTTLQSFTQIVGSERYTIQMALERIQETDKTSYALVAQSSGLSQLRDLENLLITRAKPNKPLPVTATQWTQAADPALEDMSQAVFGGGQRMVDRATPIAAGVILRLVLAGGLGFLALVSSIVVTVTTTRALLRQLERLRAAAHELADERLPSVVERLGHGEQVDVSVEAPDLAFGDDEIGQVGQAFNKVQETAIRTAVEQAELRRGIRDILLSLARRSQALVHRQLSLLDTMERREHDTTELEDLFRVDHLATRMRRNAENLIVLSGATPARGWRRPVPMVDVVRSAVAEVEDYTRVRVLPFGDFALTGRAVGDIAHLLAELIENAVSFSPPYTEAQISGHMAATGYAVEIEDRGLGMSDEALASINGRISDPPEFNLSASVQLGLYVVGRLAERYDVKVMLKHSPYGGTTAVVLIPRELIIEGQHAEERPPVPVGAAEQAATPLPSRTAGSAAGALSAADAGPGPGDRPAGPGPIPQIPLSAPVGPAPIGPAPAGPRAAAQPPTGGPDRPAAAPAQQPASQAPASQASQAEPASPASSADSGPEPTHTPSGLPVRLPQASLAPPLRNTPAPASAAAPDEPDDDVRSPEEIRKIVGAFQTGTKRGRDAAARVSDQDGDEQ